MGKGLLYLKNWGIWVNYCWNYRPSELLLQFIEYRLDQLNNKHTKIALNSAIEYFKGCSQKKKISAKKLELFGPPTTKWRPSKVFAKLNGHHLLMANIFKLHKYQMFGLIKMHMCAKSDLPITYSVCYDKIKSIFDDFSRAFSCQRLSCVCNYIEY